MLGTAFVTLTYFAMRPHVAERPLLDVLRDALREAYLAAVSQAMLPFHFVVGGTYDGVVGPCPVVLVHGYAHNRVAFRRLGPMLRARGLGPIRALNYPFYEGIHDSGARLGAFVERVLAETGARRIDLVCHSMGGLVALAYLATPRGRRVTRRCVTIGTPHAGIVWRGPLVGRSAAELRQGSELLRGLGSLRLGTPMLSIYSCFDNVVHPPATSCLGVRGRDLELTRGGHLALLDDAAVADAVVAFLTSAASRVVPSRRS